jgi:hypothetical protein
MNDLQLMGGAGLPDLDHPFPTYEGGGFVVVGLGFLVHAG